MTKTYYITTSAYMHRNLFQRTETADLLVDTILHYRNKGEFLLHQFVIMPNHMHLLITVDDDHSVGRAVQMIKGGFSHAYGKIVPRLAVWQPSYYEHRVRDDGEYERMRDYIHQNPVRRNLIQASEDYPHSSARTSWRLDEVPGRLKPQVQDYALRRA